MSLTSPMTTLTLGQDAPMPNRSFAAPSSTLPSRSRAVPTVFLRRGFRQRADYTANPTFESDAASTGLFSPSYFRDSTSPPFASPSAALHNLVVRPLVSRFAGFTDRPFNLFIWIESMLSAQFLGAGATNGKDIAYSRPAWNRPALVGPGVGDCVSDKHAVVFHDFSPFISVRGLTGASTRTQPVVAPFMRWSLGRTATRSASLTVFDNSFGTTRGTLLRPSVVSSLRSELP